VRVERAGWPLVADDARPGVLFDVDGTLLDTNYLHALAWWQAFRDHGHDDVDMATCHRLIGVASEEFVTRVLGEDAPDRQDVVDSHSSRYEALQDQVTAFPRTADLLQACSDLGLAVVLATSAKSGDLDWMLPTIGVDDVLAGTTTSEDVEAAKPAPDLLATAARDHGLDPRRTVAVGDTVWDVYSARDAGFPCVAVTCGGISRADLEAAGAVAVYDDPADLLEHLAESPLGKAAGAGD
jgi:HAD superfamily hydrolase (TIGR01509 family)